MTALAQIPPTYQMDTSTTCIIHGCNASSSNLRRHILKNHIYMFRSSSPSSPSRSESPDETPEQTWVNLQERINSVNSPLTEAEMVVANKVLEFIPEFFKQIFYHGPCIPVTEFNSQRVFSCPIPDCDNGIIETRKELRQHFFTTHTDMMNMDCPMQGCDVVFSASLRDLYEHLAYNHDQGSSQAYKTCVQVIDKSRNQETMLKHILDSSPVFLCPFPDCAKVFGYSDSTVGHIRAFHCRGDAKTMNDFRAAEANYNGNDKEEFYRVMDASLTLMHLKEFETVSDVESTTP
jgi:hypothetical protein